MFSENERRDILLIFFEKNKSSVAALREYRRRFPNRRVPSRYTCRRLFQKFCLTASCQPKKRTKRNFVVTQDIEIDILAFFYSYPTKSIRDLKKELPGVSIGSIVRVLKKYKLHPYKLKRVQKLRATDYDKRRQFCRFIMARQTDDETFLRRVLWTDESSFSTSRGSHKGNTHFWSQHNPRQIEEIQYQGRQSLSVWCGVVGNFVLGPLIYDGGLTGERYFQFLREPIEEMIDDLPINVLRNIVWQQDGAPPHTIVAVRNFLNTHYEEWIGKSGTISWPPNSPDLTLMDLYFWGHIKSLVYQTPCYTVDELRIRIEQAVNEVRNNINILQKLPGRIEKVFNKCIELEGRHVQQYLKKKYFL